MIVRIKSSRNGVLTILTIIFFLNVQIPLVTCTDSQNQHSTSSRTNSTEVNNPTGVLDQSASHSNDNNLTNATFETVAADSSSVVINDSSTGSNDSKSDIVEEAIRSTASPLAADNQTNDDHAHTNTSPTKRNLSHINSFEEWKQQQLQADLQRKGETTSHSNGASETPSISSTSTSIPQGTATIGSQKKGKLRKNFASASCGAKILAHNAEAQNTASILSSSPDEYMLNPCNAKIWFVIELCESIRILNIEIANFELFSSVPKTFRVSASDRYPTKDWTRHHLGTFNATFNRTIQSFQTKQSTTYMKYVKFELLDFHGHEHYCPLSVVRIHGSNVEEEIMIMEENTNNLIDSKPLSDGLTDNNNDDDDGDDDNSSNDQQVGGIIGSAIMDLAKRVFRRPTPARDTASTTPTPLKETNILKTNCPPAVLNGSLLHDSTNSWHQTHEFERCIAEYLRGLWSNIDTCAVFLSQNCFKTHYCCQCPLKVHTTKVNEIVTTLNFYINPCGYYHILTNQFVCKRESLNHLNETLLPTLNNTIDSPSNVTEKQTTTDHNNDEIIVLNESVNTSSEKSTSKVNHHVSSNETTLHLHDRSNEQSSVNNISDEATSILELQISSNITNQSNVQSVTIESLNESINMSEQSIDISNIDEIVSTTTTTITTPVFSTVNSNEAVPPVIPSALIKGMLLNAKSLPELYKIIEKLNFNLTLSNRYLQELSEHYVKKLDETQHTTDLLLQASKAADERLENFQAYLNKLDKDFNEVSSCLTKLDAWKYFFFLLLFVLIIWSILSTCCLLQLRQTLSSVSRELKEIQTTKQTQTYDNTSTTIDDHSFTCNGLKQRKLSTDSNDSNPNRSQRVPDSIQGTIKHNGVHHSKSTVKRRSPNLINNSN